MEGVLIRARARAGGGVGNFIEKTLNGGPASSRPKSTYLRTYILISSRLEE